MSRTQPHPNTSLNENQPSNNTQIEVDALKRHMATIAGDINQKSRSVTPDEIVGKLGDADYYAYYNKLLSEAELRITDQVEEPYPCLEILQGGKAITFGTLGNFFVITGKAKSRKTFLLSIIVAALLKRDTVLNAIRGQLPDQKYTVLYFDTEQISGHLMRVLKRISALSESEDLANLRLIRLRKYNQTERINAIRVAIEQTPNLGAIIIDGIKDTVFDINDAREATERANDLLNWTEEKDAHLVTIIHENKGNSNARGHLGSELVNKAETVVSVSIDPNDKTQSVVTAEYCRDKEFEPFAFSVDEQGLPVLNNGSLSTGTSTSRQKKPTAGTLKPNEVESIIRRAFTDDEHLRYSQLRTNVMEASEYHGMALAKSRAEEFIRRVEQQGYLTKVKLPKDRYDSYQINALQVS